jgi:hypothetical protein
MKLIALFVAFVSLPIGLNAQCTATPESQRANAVQVLRLINTAEHSYKTSNGQFANLEVLASSIEARAAARQLTGAEDIKLDPDAPIGGFKTEFVLGKESYAIVAVPVDPTCKSGFATTEKGTIFRIEILR